MYATLRTVSNSTARRHVDDLVLCAAHEETHEGDGSEAGLGGRECAMQGSTTAAYHGTMIHGAERLFAQRPVPFLCRRAVPLARPMAGLDLRYL